MWRRDRRPTGVVRIGRHAVECWVTSGASLVLTVTEPLPFTPSLAELAVALRAALARVPAFSPSAVIESVWMPLVLADTGRSVWAPAPIEALVRHRLGMNYRDTADPVAGWDLRVDHRPGDAQALGFGLPAKLKQVVMDCARERGVAWTSVLPAWAWGLDRLRPQRALPGRSGWWVWPEQDRHLVARFSAGRLVGLNPGAKVGGAAPEIDSAVAHESVRLGLSPLDAHISVATWGAASVEPASGSVVWASIPAGRAARSGPSAKALA